MYPTQQNVPTVTPIQRVHPRMSAMGPNTCDGCTPQVFYYPVQGATGVTGPPHPDGNFNLTGATEGCIIRYNSDQQWVITGKESVLVGEFTSTLGHGVAVGKNAKTGHYGLSLGNSAGNLVNSHNVVLNGSGSELSPSSSNSFWVKPVRAVSSASGYQTLLYDASTGEIVYLSS